ncbi:MAG: hypothetical protein NZ108_04365, partial [Bacteroidia bacterium]|nr:hypothetical protein [Bacteroidia bacterium]
MFYDCFFQKAEEINQRNLIGLSIQWKTELREWIFPTGSQLPFELFPPEPICTIPTICKGFS